MTRRNRESEVELLDAFTAGGQYFVVVSLCRLGILDKFRFATSPGGLAAMKKMFDMRPFETLPGVKRRFFFSGATASLDEGKNRADKFGLVIYIEEGSKIKQFEISSPKELMQNLLWFQQLKDLSEANHLRMMGDGK